MRLIRRWWALWRLDAAREELRDMQARSDVGPRYLCHVMQHINHLERHVKALSS